jgi:NADH-quinone oxidoreductase subunit N
MNTLIAIIGLGVLCLLFRRLESNRPCNNYWIIGRTWSKHINLILRILYNMIIVKFSTAFSGLFIMTMEHKV